MSTWSEDRARPSDNRPRRWLADSVWRFGHGWHDPELSDADLETATDAQLARLLNLLGWPVLPAAENLGPWTGGTHWP